MEPTYLYKVTGLRKVESLNGLTDVVSSVDINITANSGVEGNADISWSITEMYVEIPSSDSFTPFEELTEEQVLSWIQNDKQYIEVMKLIEREIDDQINPKLHVAQLPWASETVVPPM